MEQSGVRKDCCKNDGDEEEMSQDVDDSGSYFTNRHDRPKQLARRDVIYASSVPFTMVYYGNKSELTGTFQYKYTTTERRSGTKTTQSFFITVQLENGVRVG